MRPEKPTLEKPEALRLQDFNWKVSGGQFCLDARAYAALSRDDAEVLRWVKETSKQLDYYRGESE